MFHFFAQHENIHDTYIDIVGSDVNHLKNVLRCKTGDSLLISSGDNVDYRCTISDMTKEYIRARIDSAEDKARELPAEVYLYQGLPKGDKMEMIIQKMTELGVAGIIPVSMKRSVVKLDTKKAEAKVKRWNAIAESAAKQSKRSVIPEVFPVMDFDRAIEQAAACEVKLLPYECADGMLRTKQIISGLKAGERVAILIGPEGGFDLEELELAGKAGWTVITLGSRILRTETAGMMLMSVLMYHFEE